MRFCLQLEQGWLGFGLDMVHFLLALSNIYGGQSNHITCL